MHSGEKFECDECDAELTSSNGLRKHQKYKHSGEKFECDECGAKLSSARYHDGIPSR